MFVPAWRAQRHLDSAPCVVVTLLQESNFYPTQDDRITTDFVFIYTRKNLLKTDVSFFVIE